MRASYLPVRLWRYLATTYVRSYVMVQGILLSVYSLFNVLELLRRAGKRPEVGLDIVFSMAFYKLPEAIEMTLPFAVLLAAMACLFSLSKRHELTVLRASGLSVWQLTRPLMAVACGIGLLFITVLHPIGAAFTHRFQTLETQYLGRTAKIITITEQGLWLREVLPDNADVILFANKIDLKDWSLHNVMALFFNAQGEFEKRMDVDRAELQANQWQFFDTAKTTLPTNLTRDDIVQSFSDPDTISFWKLPRFIHTLKDTGLETTAIVMYFQSLLVLPLFLPAMILLAATVSMRPPRFQSGLLLVLMGMGSGFAIFFLSNFLKALGSTHQLPPALAAWIPVFLVAFLSATYLLNAEDG